MIDIRKLSAPGLAVDHFTVGEGEAWCLIGDNASGMEQFCAVLSGDATDFKADRLELPADLGVVSFHRQQRLYEKELLLDDTDFLNRIDPGTPVREFLTDVDRHADLIRLFGLADILDRGYRQLSSGQSRKLILLQQITRGASFLVIENPYEGLDTASTKDLELILAQLHGQGIGLLVLVGNADDIPLWCTHLAVLHQGKIALQGPLKQTIAEVRHLLCRQPALFHVSVEEIRTERLSLDTEKIGHNLITLNNGFARYGEIEVFRGLNLTVNQGDHTLITGPNGCGKSTLLQIITGDHPLCYANDLHLFGTKRGSGESIWEVKRHMGIVSHELHRNYRAAGTALAAVVSGLFDSIGLYVQPIGAQVQLARTWLQRLNLAHRAQKPFRLLSFGEQRLILVARALIKVPRLLVLDEPTLGLDQANRTALLDFLAALADEDCCTILYVSHRPDEYRSFFRQRVLFDGGNAIAVNRGTA